MKESILYFIKIITVSITISYLICKYIIFRGDRLTAYFRVANKSLIPCYKNKIYQHETRKAKQELKELENNYPNSYKQRMLINNAKSLIGKLKKGVTYKTHTHENIKEEIKKLENKGIIQIIKIRKDILPKPLLVEKFSLYKIHSIKDFKDLFKQYNFYTIKFKRI